jgi:hypothetical protein
LFSTNTEDAQYEHLKAIGGEVAVTIQKLPDKLYIPRSIGWSLGFPISFSSEIYHSVVFKLKTPGTRLENGMLIMSVDVDVGNKKLGMINKGKNDANVNDYLSECSVGKIEEQAFPLFIDCLNNLEIPATFAIRGQLAEASSSIFEALLKSPVKHDIGAHGYYHRDFTKLSHDEAENELNMISAAMKKLGIAPKSFVFPKNRVAYLYLLEKYGYKCYRGIGGFKNDCMNLEKQGRLYDIHPSLHLGRSISPILLKRILDVAIAKKAPLHVWFHLWNFGESSGLIRKYINNAFFPLLKYAKKKEKSGTITFETMLSCAH